MVLIGGDLVFPGRADDALSWCFFDNRLICRINKRCLVKTITNSENAAIDYC